MKNFIVLSSILVTVYLTGLAFILIRRKSAYIIRRSPLMLAISLIGNLILSLAYLSQIEIIYQELGPKITESCDIFYRTRQSINILSHYILFFPYVLRVYRLHIIFKVDKYWENSYFSYTKYTQRTKQIWMLTVFCICMIPVLMMIVVILAECQLAEYFPASESNLHSLYSESFYLSICFIEELFLILSIYQLRNVSDDFEMTKELLIVSIVWFITPSMSIFPPINLKEYKSLPGLIRNIVLFLVSTLLPIIGSYVFKHNEEIITTEMLDCFETILQSKICLNHFERFLKELEGRMNDSKMLMSGNRLLQLYMKCENFIMFPELHDKDELIEEILDVDVVPISYVNNEKDGLEVHVGRAKEAVMKILDSEFFEIFKASKRFSELKRIVYRQEIYVGRLMEIGLTLTYTSL